jgi:hypothetical protein
MPTGWLGWGGAVVVSIRHRSREVRQDLVALRARDALVSVRTELINTARGLVKSMGMEKYGHTTLLRQLKGVGPITSLAYVLALEDPQRFSRKSRGRALSGAGAEAGGFRE